MIMKREINRQPDATSKRIISTCLLFLESTDVSSKMPYVAWLIETKMLFIELVRMNQTGVSCEL
jgi:hypothetical protein